MVLVDGVLLRVLFSILFLFVTSLSNHYRILNTTIDVFSLFLSELDLVHQALEIDGDIFAINIDLFDHTLMNFLSTDLLDPSLPCQGFLHLLVENNHLLSDVAITFLLLKHFKQLTHLQLFVDRNVLASFIITSLDVALFLDFLGEFYRLFDLLFNIRGRGLFDLVKDCEMVLELLLVDSIVKICSKLSNNFINFVLFATL